MSLCTTGGWLCNLVGGLNNITGSEFASYLILILILMVLFIALWKISAEWVAVSMSGIILVLLAYSGEWMLLFGIMSLLFALIIAYKWFAS